MEKDPAEVLKDNVRILLENYRQVHRLALGFRWKRIPPFSLIFRTTENYAFADTLEKTGSLLTEQAQAAVRLAKESKGERATYFRCMREYVERLREAVHELSEWCLRVAEGNLQIAENKERLARYAQLCERYHGAALELAEAYGKIANRP